MLAYLEPGPFNRMKSETAKWADVIKRSGTKIE